ncbi:MAG: DUF2938 domain-containing protein, partial [Mesorhizobium sp.]
AALLMGVWGIDWARYPTLLPALLVGMFSVVAPFFLMQPAFGAGRQPRNSQPAHCASARPHVLRVRTVCRCVAFGTPVSGLTLIGCGRLSRHDPNV